MAVSGLVLNIYLAAYVSNIALGVFNQVYAAYVIAAQIAAFGLQESALRHVAQHHKNPVQRSRITATAFVLAGISGICVSVAVGAAAPLIGAWTESTEVGEGIFLAAFGLPLFSVNKVLLGTLNGRRQMGHFALGQAIRAIGILSMCVWVGETGEAYAMFGLCFTVTELALLPFLITAVGWRVLVQGLRQGRGVWWRQHFSFGLRGLPSGLLAEMFVRVDILMLGIFLDDGQVGIYSFAALFLEGLYQIPVVIRTIVNPMLARAELPDAGGLHRSIWRVAVLAVALTLLAGGTLLLVFPFFVAFFPVGLVEESLVLLEILLLGLMLYAAFIPFEYLLLQSGRPGAQSLMMGVNVCANIALNVVLIPHFGAVGAALATALSFGVSVLTLNLAVWKFLGMRGGVLFANHYPRFVE